MPEVLVRGSEVQELIDLFKEQRERGSVVVKWLPPEGKVDIEFSPAMPAILFRIKLFKGFMGMIGSLNAQGDTNIDIPEAVRSGNDVTLDFGTEGIDIASANFREHIKIVRVPTESSAPAR